MGSWGTKPFENDGALDLKDEWEESGNLSVLEYALDTIMANKEDSVIDAIDAEAAIASANIIVNMNDDLSSKLLEKLLKKSVAAINRIIENSELKEIWSETEFFGDWLTSLIELIQVIVEKLQALPR